jgi:adenylate cyclase
MHPLSVEELAEQADVDARYVQRLIDLGALERTEGPAPYGGTDLRRVRLLRAWEGAGLPVEAVMRVVREGTLSLSWLDTPVMTRAERLDLTYEQLCREEEVSLSLVQAIQEALGFAPPEPSDRVRQGDQELVRLVRSFISVGAGQEPTLRLLRVYADSLRRIAKAEAELYETRIERRLRESGLSEADLLDYSGRFGEQVVPALQRALVDVYQRHREHVWIEHSISHAEIALEAAGLYQKVPRPPAICFVDLTGYTRLTEEQGDEVAARVATSLASMVENISRRHGGTPIRWLGDGGMFHFKDPGAAVVSGLDMVESAPRAGLPPMHIGIHTGPVIFQDGDVYGRTVNLASRIASHATGGEVLASEGTVSRVPADGVRFHPVGPVMLKGLPTPVELFRAVREEA